MPVIRVRVLVLPVEDALARGVEVDGGGVAGPRLTLDELVGRLAEAYPRFREQVTDPGSGHLRGDIRAALNGRMVIGRDTVIEPGSEVVLFPAIAGG